MTEVMGRKSSGRTEGVPSFSFNPKERDKENTPTLFQLQDSPIDKLTESLLNDFVGQTLIMKQIYYAHGLSDKENKYVLKNYQDALRKLEEQGKIITNPSANERQKRDGIVTFGQNVLITFPERQN